MVFRSQWRTGKKKLMFSGTVVVKAGSVFVCVEEVRANEFCLSDRQDVCFTRVLCI